MSFVVRSFDTEVDARLTVEKDNGREQEFSFSLFSLFVLPAYYSSPKKKSFLILTQSWLRFLVPDFEKRLRRYDSTIQCHL